VLSDLCERPLPSQKTVVWAGSIEKIEIMRTRYEAGEHLHHPFDCKMILVDDQDRVAHARELYQKERIVRWQAGLAS